MYDAGRYFVMTGQQIGSDPIPVIEDRQQQLDAVLAEFLPAPELRLAPAPTVPIELDDPQIIDKALRNEKFRTLWDGHWNGRYQSQSEADLALAAMLAFWTGRDPARIDRMFKSSGLMREKWGEGRLPHRDDRESDRGHQ